MKAIYKDAKDKHVAAYVIYVDDDHYACSDPECKNKMTAAELEDAFIKRALVYNESAGRYTVPAVVTCHNDSTAYARITVGENTVYSKEYSAD